MVIVRGLTKVMLLVAADRSVSPGRRPLWPEGAEAADLQYQRTWWFCRDLVVSIIIVSGGRAENRCYSFEGSSVPLRHSGIIVSFFASSATLLCPKSFNKSIL